MDLLLKSVIAAVFIVALIFAGYYVIGHVSFSRQVTKQQAVSLVLHDLQNSYPNALVNITNATPSEYSGSWHILASIIFNATSPCPSYYIYSFDYPKYGFVSRMENTYTSGCEVFGSSGSGNAIGSYPAAITASYESRNYTILGPFIEAYGFGNVTAHATYYQFIDIPGQRCATSNCNDVWVVNYTTPKSPQHGVEIFLSQVNGSVLAQLPTNTT